MLDTLISNVENIIGWGLAVFSIGFALHESKKNRELKKLIRFNNWMYFQSTSNLGGTIQKSLVIASSNEIDRELYGHIVKSDTLCGELMKENVRLIYTFEPSFTQKDIKRWVNEGKITGGYDAVFKKCMIDKE